MSVLALQVGLTKRGRKRKMDIVLSHSETFSVSHFQDLLGNIFRQDVCEMPSKAEDYVVITAQIGSDQPIQA